MDRKVLWDLKAKRVSRDLQDPLDRKVLWEPKELSDLLGQRGLLDLRDQ